MWLLAVLDCWTGRRAAHSVIYALSLHSHDIRTMRCYTLIHTFAGLAVGHICAHTHTTHVSTTGHSSLLDPHYAPSLSFSTSCVDVGARKNMLLYVMRPTMWRLPAGCSGCDETRVTMSWGNCKGRLHTFC